MSVEELLKAHGRPSREVYFDNENSGYVPREVVEEMIPYFNSVGYGHPSITHRPGWEAYEVVYKTKEALAKVLNTGSVNEFSIVHSGTEANNLAVLGYALASRERKGKIVVSAIEHLSVIHPAEEAERLLGFKVVRVPVDSEGFVDPEVFKELIDRNTSLVSIQMVNHEIGTIQNIYELSKIAKEVNSEVVFHTDAADAFGKLAIDLKKLEHVDMVTLSSHKIHGPRGVGILFTREGVRLESILKGQLSSEKLWPGVENVPLIAGFRKAVELAFENFDSHVAKMSELRNLLIKGISDRVSDVLVNGPIDFSRRAPDNANLSFLYVEGEALTVELSINGVYVSSGSACSSRILEPSHVLLAIGRKHEEAHGSILFKTTRYHNREDIEYTLEVVPRAVSRLRSISAAKKT
ncbi:MAG: cysteine desulfurase family protein [Sulfolobales archaeon]|nr:cysteine desulfurase [Sulfolobales archaeon]MDW8082558.1 cysteine desulfurase family protein [Sulfolobales archaeon]